MQRANYLQQSPELFKKVLELSNALKESAIEEKNARSRRYSSFAVERLRLLPRHAREAGPRFTASASYACTTSRPGANPRCSFLASAPPSRGRRC